MWKIYLASSIFIIFAANINEAYPQQRSSFQDIYYPIRNDAPSQIQPFFQVIMIPNNNNIHKNANSNILPANVFNAVDNNNNDSERQQQNAFHLLPSYNKIAKRSDYDEQNMGKRVYLARVGKRQYYSARIG